MASEGATAKQGGVVRDGWGTILFVLLLASSRYYS